MSSKIGELAIDRNTLEAKIEWSTKGAIGYYIMPCSDEVVSLCNARCCNSVPLTRKEAEELAGKTVFAKGRHYMKEKNYSCQFLDNANRCENYSNRPLVCKAHPLGLTRISSEVFQIIVRHCEAAVEPVTKDSPEERKSKVDELNNVLSTLAQEFYKDNHLPCLNKIFKHKDVL